MVNWWFYFIFLILVSISLALFFVLKALNDKIVFFYTPTNLSEDSDIIGENIRVGGLVLENSIKYSNECILCKKIHSIFHWRCATFI